MTNEAIVLEMVVIEPATIMEAFTNGEALDDAIGQVRSVVEGFEHDMTTKAGRDKTRSFAAKIPKVKSALIDIGHGLTAEWKSKAKLVDKSIKSMKESLDEQRDIARKPLTDWEDQQEKEKADLEAIEADEKLAAQIESDHDYALLMNEKIERDAIEAKAETERQAKAKAEFEERLRKDREANIAQEAAERATREANEKAFAEKAEAIRKAEAQTAAIKTAQEAEQRAKLEHEEALKRAEAQRIQAIKDAEDRAQLEAKNKEDARIAEQARIEKERADREANKAHCRKINNSVLADLVAAGLDESTSKNLIKLIATGKISHTKITY